MKLTGNVHNGGLALTLAVGRPSDALALELLLAEVLLDVVPGDVEVSLYIPHSCLGVHKLLVRMRLTALSVMPLPVALEVHLDND